MILNYIYFKNFLIGAAFLGSIIFFIFMSNIFTPMESVIYIVIITIGFKGLANYIIGLLIRLENIKD